MASFDLVAQALARYRNSSVDETVSPNDSMFDPGYKRVGISAMNAILLAWQSSDVDEITRVLDIPCGHGRVLRHLVKLFPEAMFDACDLDQDGIAFCAKTFGARPLLSREALTTMQFDTTYDLIWVGSLFTHVSRDIARAWLEHLAKFLSPKGVLVGTTHGRWSEHVYQHYPYISPEGWNTVMEGYRKSGYGYCDYQAKENHAYIEGTYGISMARPHVTIGDIEQIPDTRLLHYSERGWADHQDVFAIGKPALTESWPWWANPQ
ncbi:class I SAM-dependent methyltransferase [Dyella tabacisoli]|nr:class I SAM-dependent methyltransferase [Dyella tabacisoli]